MLDRCVVCGATYEKSDGDSTITSMPNVWRRRCEPCQDRFVTTLAAMTEPALADWCARLLEDQ